MIKFFLTSQYDTIHAYAKSLTRNSYDADDLTQDTVLRILERPELIPRSPEEYLAWTKRVMKNIFLNSKRREEMRDLEDIEEPGGTDMIDPTQETLCLLPENLREIFKLGLEGWKGKEISVKLGIPEGTVKTRMARAKAMLRQKFFKKA